MPIDQNRPPIAPPLPTPADLGEGFADVGPFRYHFWRFFRAIFLYVGLVTLFLLIILTPTIRTEAAMKTMLISCFCLWPGLSLLITWFYRNTFYTYAGRNGVRSQTTWGVTANVAWPEITRVKRIWFLFLFYLKTSTTQKRVALWIPLFLEDLPRFAQAVQEFAPPNHPLRRYFEENTP